MSEYKSWRNNERVWLKDVVPLDTPFNLHLDVSAVCNARCVYCGQSKTPGKTMMSMELFEHAIEQAKAFPQKLKVLDLYYTGESLCNPLFPDMVAKAHAADVAEKIGVTTNGILLTKEKIDGIIAGGINEIRISIQGLDAAAYQRVCGVRIDYETFLRNLRYLYEHKEQANVRIKIADVALHGVEDGEAKFREMFGGIADSIFVERIVPLYKDVNYDALDKDIQKHAQDGRYAVAQQRVNSVCYRPFIKLLVATNGDVCAACCDHISGRDKVYGNIYESTLVDVWQGRVHQDFMEMQLRGDRFHHPLCKDCVVPNDIVNERDCLDPFADEVLEKISRLKIKSGGVINFQTFINLKVALHP